MNSTIKNIIIGVVVVIALFLVYIFFIKKSSTDASLTSSSGSSIVSGTSTTGIGDSTSDISNSFLAVLLSVKSIKLDDSVLRDPAFLSLKDSSIVLVQDGNEGRVNPFAPIGSEAMVPSSGTGLNVDTNSTSASSTLDNGNSDNNLSTTDSTTSKNTTTDKNTNKNGSKKN